MRAIEDLLGDVRDRASRDQLEDAVRAYGSGALRAAIISTWVAVALDLTSKIRELADLGEAAAKDYVSRLDVAIENRDLRALGAFEHELLDKSRDDFSLIDAREHLDLSRLQEDRHVCAHPAYVTSDVVFAPSPELCRSHLRAAVESVLRHPPAPARGATTRFIAEIRDAAWPRDRSALAAHLDARYLRRAKATARRGLVQLIIKGCFDPPDGDELVCERSTEAAHAVHQVAPDLFAEGLREVVRKREESKGFNEEQLLRLVGALGDLDLLWEALPETSHPRAVAALRHGKSEDLVRLRVTGVQMANPAASEALAERLDQASTAALTAVVTSAPGPLLVPSVMRRLAEAANYREAERLMGLLPPLTPHFKIETVRHIAKVVRENDQVRMAGGVPPLITDLFERTRKLPGAPAEWRELSDWLRATATDGDLTDYYAYPNLAEAVREANAPDVPQA